jgi:hypothetical protein
MAGEQGLSMLPDQGENPEALFLERDILAAAGEVMGSLRPEDVKTLRAAIEEEARPDVPAATFRKRLSRAVGRLRTAWRAKHGTD